MKDLHLRKVIVATQLLIIVGSVLSSCATSEPERQKDKMFERICRDYRTGGADFDMAKCKAGLGASMAKEMMKYDPAVVGLKNVNCKIKKTKDGPRMDCQPV